VEVLTAAACLDLDISYHAMKNQVDSVIRERGLLEKEEKNPRKKGKKSNLNRTHHGEASRFRPDT
jgi:hypothetical protein